MLNPQIKERLDEITDERGDLFVANFVFWKLIDQLPEKWQKEALRIAERANEDY